jgi:hypothetical protein
VARNADRLAHLVAIIAFKNRLLEVRTGSASRTLLHNSVLNENISAANNDV